MHFHQCIVVEFDDDTIRDLVFKGYVIVYKIRDDYIDVFGFTKYQETPVDGQGK